jgi:hypothetical protein
MKPNPYLPEVFEADDWSEWKVECDRLASKVSWAIPPTT